MAAIDLPFGASATRRAPSTSELSGGFTCGAADQRLFNWLHWWKTGQIDGVIERSGLATDDTDLLQLAKAVRSQAMNYRTVGGTTNALTITLDPAPTTYADLVGVPLRVKIAATNTGAVTVDVNALGTRSVLRRRGTALQTGDLVAGAIYELVYDGTAFRLLAIASAEVPIIPTANPVLWVRPDGNDANDGSANNAASAFKTIAAAVTYGSRKFALAGWTMTIRLGAAGTYDAPGNIASGGGAVQIQGDAAAQGNYIIRGANAPTGVALLSAAGCDVTLIGATVINDGTTHHSVGAAGGGSVNLFNVSFSNTVVTTMSTVAASQFSNATLHTGNVFGGAFASMILAAGGSVGFAASAALTGTPSYSVATVNATTCGTISNNGFAFTGTTANGSRYTVSLNGVINTYGGGVSFFPGSTAGTTATGGQYA